MTNLTLPSPGTAGGAEVVADDDPDCPRCRGGGCEWCANTGRVGHLIHSGGCPAERGGEMKDCAAYPACACDHPGSAPKDSRFCNRYCADWPQCKCGACISDSLPEQRVEYRDARPLTNYAFAAYVARIGQKSAAWAADTLQTIPEDILDPIKAATARRYLSEIRQLLDHIEQQVRR
jgi:hypothetical protein